MPRSGGAEPGRRAEVLRVLKAAPGPLPITDIADRLGAHPNTVRFHLDRLLENGQVERAVPAHRTAGRPPQLFRAVRGMDPAGPRHYRMLAEVLADTLGAEPDARGRAVEAGRAWGRRYGGAPDPTGRTHVQRLVALLDDLGFAPGQAGQAGQGGGPPRIELRNCPFLELAADRPQIVCPLHLGLMQGAMDAWGAAETVDRLDPFVTADVCVAHLTGGDA
ncbi:helix-turn-helix transcriptional regulator [Spongiactinospora gelatinilytica]|uniref:helix-turn-helix transcriptional regulator n=1 Tax=Spongiactinospora gelatinilytica TaxID=2666298 RepID=UPI0022775D98|nr:helix-turn-helix domain-containing protein [Spongiactinospora gelatinilytica]